MNNLFFDIEKENNIWYTSDTHYYHKNIVYGESEWDDKEINCRPFNNRQEMSQHIVDRINKYVDENDILIHMGDWSFGGIQNIWNFRKLLKVKTIILILGNHDHHIRKNKVLPNCYKNVNGNIVDIDLINDDEKFDCYAQEIFSYVYEDLILNIGKNKLYLRHHPHTTWAYNNETIHLYGHVHGKRGKTMNSIDVGIDNAFKMFAEYRPFNHGESINILNK